MASQSPLHHHHGETLQHKDTTAQESQYLVSDEFKDPLTHDQTVKLTNVEANSIVYRKATSAKGLIHRFNKNLPTGYHAFKHAVELFGNGDCLGRRVGNSFQFLSYNQVYERVKRIANGLRQLGVPARGGHVGLYSRNRIEWQLVSEACNTQSMVTISLYDSLGEGSSEYIINHGEIHTLCLSMENLDKVKHIAPHCPMLKHIIIFPEYDDNTSISNIPVKIHDKHVYTLQQVEQIGSQVSFEPVPPEPSMLATIMYTSGTTGVPKGVMISK